MDAPPGRGSEIGGNVAIAIDVEDAARAGRIFAKLAEDGNVLMPFEETFFASRFGMASDKFGVRWMVSVAPLARDGEKTSPASGRLALDTDAVVPAHETRRPSMRGLMMRFAAPAQ